MHPPPSRSPDVRPFPWSALPAIPRESATTLRDARRAVRSAIDPDAIAGALAEIIGAKTRIDVASVDVVVEETARHHAGSERLGTTVLLGTLDDAVKVELDLDPELARTVVERALGRPLTSGHPHLPVGPEVEGALLAVVLRIARRAHGAGAPFVPRGRGEWRVAPGERRLRVHANVTLDRDAFAARAFVAMNPTLPVDEIDASLRLASLGQLPIALPLVLGASIIGREDAYRLSPGDIWLPSGGAKARFDAARTRLVGEGVLAPPSSTRGLAVKLGDGGEIVLLGETAIALDAETNMQSPNQEKTATSEIVLDAPLVVRVEVGSVTLSAAEWAALAPGDVIALGRRTHEPVVLRIAGAEVARGELVDVEGEIGVRIRERTGST